MKLTTGPAASKTMPRDQYNDFRAKIESADARRLFDYWLGLVLENGLEIKHLVDPLSVPDLLPSMYLEEWDHPTAQSKIRLAGETVKSMWGKSYLGATIDEQTQGATAELWKQCDRYNFELQAPTLCRYDLRHRDRDYRWVWDLSMPMSDRDGNRYVLGHISAFEPEESGPEGSNHEF